MGDTPDQINDRDKLAQLQDDKDAAEGVRTAVHALNNALAVAEGRLLYVELGVDNHPTMGRPRHQRVHCTIRRTL